MTNILIVDDSPTEIHVLTSMLEKHGFSIAVANSGEEGIDKAKSEKPDLIVLDVMMPDKDGYEVSKELSKDEALSGIPVIMLTAVGDYIGSTHYSHASGKDLVADDFFQKPVDPQALVDRISELLR